MAGLSPEQRKFGVPSGMREPIMVINPVGEIGIDGVYGPCQYPGHTPGMPPVGACQYPGYTPGMPSGSGTRPASKPMPKRDTRSVAIVDDSKSERRPRSPDPRLIPYGPMRRIPPPIGSTSPHGIPIGITTPASEEEDSEMARRRA